MDDARDRHSRAATVTATASVAITGRRTDAEETIISRFYDWLGRPSKLPEAIFYEKVDETVGEFLKKIGGAVRKLLFYNPYGVQ